MCLDTLEELAEAARATADAEKAYKAFKEKQNSPLTDAWLSPMELTDVEAELIHKARVERAQAKLRELGWNPPPKRVTEGERVKELEAAGHTLPGALPKNNTVQVDRAEVQTA